jgi:hypothetical protein
MSPGQMRHREPVLELDDVTLVVLHNQHEGSRFATRKATAPGGYGSFPCVHAASGFPLLIHQQHLRIFAPRAEIVGGIDREKHCFPFGLIGPVFVPVELDEPNVVLTNDYERVCG